MGAAASSWSRFDPVRCGWILGLSRDCARHTLGTASAAARGNSELYAASTRSRFGAAPSLGWRYGTRGILPLAARHARGYARGSTLVHAPDARLSGARDDNGAAGIRR